MSPDRARGAVVVLRAKSAGEVPAWLRDLDGSVRLKDGSYVVAAGQHRIGDTQYAVKCIAAELGGDLSFHDDARGVRWTRFGPIASKPLVECQVAGYGRFTAHDVDYETCVSAVGLWVPVAKVATRRQQQAMEGALQQQRAAERAAAPEEAAAPAKGAGVEHRNVVVVRSAPRGLPKEFVVLLRLEDGTVLGVGPRNKGWVDWLKKNVPLEGLRLVRGPVSDTFLKEMLSFEMLDAACRLKGQPLLVMKAD
ncbi:MAG: hypothetical protein IAE78_05395 [Myxococcus sp.]|nr:hypothetical protein [Myxococcus sp.]